MTDFIKEKNKWADKFINGLYGRYVGEGTKDKLIKDLSDALKEAYQQGREDIVTEFKEEQKKFMRGFGKLK